MDLFLQTRLQEAGLYSRKLSPARESRESREISYPGRFPNVVLNALKYGRPTITKSPESAKAQAQHSSALLTPDVMTKWEGWSAIRGEK